MAQHVIVVGGGIIGSSFAYHLAAAGAEVQLLDSAKATGGIATPKSWAWINASWGNPEAYFRLRHHSMALWRQLDKDVAGLEVQWRGGLLWDLPEAELQAFVQQQAAWGYDITLVDAARVRALEPHLSVWPALAAHAPGEGAVEPEHAVEKLQRAAQARGADILHGVRVKRLVEDHGKVIGVMTDDGLLEADCVVLAAGADSNNLLKTVGRKLALDAPAGLLVHSEPVGECLNGLVLAPELHVRQTHEGRLVAGTDFGGTDPGDDPDAAADELFAKVQQFFQNGAELQLAFHTVGYRPTPRDGVSAAGFVPGMEGLYLCVTHSGITLAPALGALCGAELASGNRHPLLAPFAPGRLLETA